MSCCHVAYRNKELLLCLLVISFFITDPFANAWSAEQLPPQRIKNIQMLPDFDGMLISRNAMRSLSGPQAAPCPMDSYVRDMLDGSQMNRSATDYVRVSVVTDSDDENLLEANSGRPQQAQVGHLVTLDGSSTIASAGATVAFGQSRSFNF
jgi:hypothetical protein